MIPGHIGGGGGSESGKERKSVRGAGSSPIPQQATKGQSHWGILGATYGGRERDICTPSQMVLLEGCPSTQADCRRGEETSGQQRKPLHNRKHSDCLGPEVPGGTLPASLEGE